MQDESLRAKQQWLCWSFIRFSAENVKSFMAVFHFIFLLAALMRIYFFDSPSQLWLARPISQPESSHQWAQHQTFLNLQIKWRWGRGRRVVRWTKTIKYLDDLNIYATFILVNPPDFPRRLLFVSWLKFCTFFPILNTLWRGHAVDMNFHLMKSFEGRRRAFCWICHFNHEGGRLIRTVRPTWKAFAVYSLFCSVVILKKSPECRES